MPIFPSPFFDNRKDIESLRGIEESFAMGSGKADRKCELRDTAEKSVQKTIRTDEQNQLVTAVAAMTIATTTERAIPRPEIGKCVHHQYLLMKVGSAMDCSVRCIVNVVFSCV